MLGLVKYAQSWFYIEYLIYNHTVILWINGCQFFRIYMSNATDNNSFGSLLTAMNEVYKLIYYIVGDIYFYSIVVQYSVWCLPSVSRTISILKKNPFPGKFP